MNCSSLPKSSGLGGVGPAVLPHRVPVMGRMGLTLR